MDSQHVLTPAALARLLAIRDLSDPAQGPHAIQLALRSAVATVAAGSSCEIVTHRSGPIVSRLDDERLGHASESARMERRVSPIRVLRTAMTSSVPAVLRQIAMPAERDLLVVCAGTVHPPYTSLRRASRDVRPTAVHHEAELWRLRRNAAFSLREVGQMMAQVACATVPGLTLSAGSSSAAHLTEARSLDVRVRGAWVEIGRCGLVDPELLADLRLPRGTTAMSMTLDLDRAVMVAKGISDARILRSRDSWVSAQMLDLEPYVPAELAGHRNASPRAPAIRAPGGYVRARLRG